jgi:hypothetical protein
LAGKAALLQPPRRRPYCALFVEARHFSTDKWFVSEKEEEQPTDQMLRRKNAVEQVGIVSRRKHL